MLAPRPSPVAPRRAFTLVELLVVIVIIIILMGLLLPVLMNVSVRAREARMISEIGLLDSAMKAYKERYGSYPPSNFSDLSATGPVAIHLQKAFPRCNVSTELNAITAVGGTGITPAQALCFWLSGFSPDPERPISGKTASNTTFLFAFIQTQLVYPSGATVAVYVPADGVGAPYVYHASQNYGSNSYTGTQGGSGTCKPYLADNSGGGYVNPNSFQIIGAGMDGNYGSGNGSFPSGTGYNQFDSDNLTNFATSNLYDAQPH